MINYKTSTATVSPPSTWDMPNRTMNVLNEASDHGLCGAHSTKTALKDRQRSRASS